MSDTNINNMNIKQLRNEVQLLRDEIAIMKRKYEDILYNLDTDNFSTRVVKQGENMYTKIEQNAESISLQAEKIGENSQSISNLEVTAGEIKAEVTELNAEDERLSARISVTSSEIRSVVSKNISTKFESHLNPNEMNWENVENAEKYKSMLCEYNGNLYYYNDVSEEWKIYPYADGVKSQFIQTSSGFEFTNDVKINADLIVKGTIDAARIETDELSCTKLYAKGENSYSTMDENGVIIYDNNSIDKVRIGCQTVGATNYPYLGLGEGSDWTANGRGIVLKLGNGIWIGDDSIAHMGGYYPGGFNIPANVGGIGGVYTNTTGIFIDFYNDKIYKYIRGNYTEL